MSMLDVTRKGRDHLVVIEATDSDGISAKLMLDDDECRRLAGILMVASRANEFDAGMDTRNEFDIPSGDTQ